VQKESLKYGERVQKEIGKGGEKKKQHMER